MDEDTKQIKDQLFQGPCLVTFIKVDGTKRIMKCTLNEQYIPHETNTNNPIDFPKKVKKENPDVLAVWDLEKEGWRSFRFDTILEIEPCIAG
jgi:hypothetical protein